MKRPKNSTSDIAVALHYDGSNAPTVTAKGRDQLARRIMQVAQEHGVPLHEDEYLVQFLSTIELGDEIPENLYRAVAEVIAFAYYLSGRVPGDPV
jgi:flagellar biosynthesis protein